MAPSMEHEPNGSRSEKRKLLYEVNPPSTKPPTSPSSPPYHAHPPTCKKKQTTYLPTMMQAAVNSPRIEKRASGNQFHAKNQSPSLHPTSSSGSPESSRHQHLHPAPPSPPEPGYPPHRSQIRWNRTRDRKTLTHPAI
jgi:hypothetical protein